MTLVMGIDAKHFTYQTPSPTGNGYDIGRMDWVLTMEKEHGRIRFASKRAEMMNQCYLKAAYKTDVYCGAAIALRAGRNEDAAKALEELTLFEEADQVRKRALHERNTSRNVPGEHEPAGGPGEAGRPGLVYECPSCGGSIRIDKEFNPGMKICGC
jgi:hypothetical protein